MKKNSEIIRYIVVGILTTAVSLGTYWILTSTILDPKLPFQLLLANIISWICSVTFAFIANRKYVFFSDKINILSEAVKFYGSRISTLILDVFFMWLLVSIFGIDNRMAKLIVQVIVFITNYLLSKFFVFS